MTFRDTILYSRDTLTIVEVYNALVSKEKIKHVVIILENEVESLVIRGKSLDKNLGGNMKGMSKPIYREKVCHFLQKEGTH